VKRACGLLLFLAFQSGCSCLGGTSSQAILGVQWTNQMTELWCWAASGQMIMSYLGTNVAQCVQADAFFRVSVCCSSNIPAICINGGWPQFEKYGFQYDRTHNQALTFSQIQDQINQKKPVAFSWHWIDDQGNYEGGHMMVLYGWEIVDGVPYVIVHDPNSEYEGEMAYEAYTSGSNHTHWDDFYDIGH